MCWSKGKIIRIMSHKCNNSYMWVSWVDTKTLDKAYTASNFILSNVTMFEAED